MMMMMVVLDVLKVNNCCKFINLCFFVFLIRVK